MVAVVLGGNAVRPVAGTPCLTPRRSLAPKGFTLKTLARTAASASVSSGDAGMGLPAVCTRKTINTTVSKLMEANTSGMGRPRSPRCTGVPTMGKRRKPTPLSAARTAEVEANCKHLARKPGVCRKKGCGKTLTGRQTRWCSKACATWFTNQHRWTNARRQAKSLVAHYKCAKCDGFFKTVEVNHIKPCVGERGWSCHHHQINLEVVCKNCHKKITAEQRKEGLI